jgi:GNAT superfamily N-acetyltransferase
VNTTRAERATPRSATPGDAAACVRFEHGHDETRIRRWCEDGTIYVADLDGDVIGYLRLEYIWGHVPYMALITLDKDVRGRGLGRRLLGFVEDALRKQGHKALISSSQVNEPPPQAWHRKVGFEEIGILAGINEGGVGEVFFRKDLV